MKEELYYKEINNRWLFFHEHIPEEIAGPPFLFLNPMFDEKKRSQKFYAETAREFCKRGIPVVRFDYYGTGDSEGQLFEMSIHESLKAVQVIIETILSKYQTQSISLLGLRIGADFALEVESQMPKCINELVFIEPVVNGKRYLSEQRSRRKIFHKLNNMTSIPETISINGNTYEDHQGYPISEGNIQFINHLDSTRSLIHQKSISLVKLNTITSRKTIAQLKESLNENNNVSYISFQCDDFWASLEPIDTMGLSAKIVGIGC